MTNKIATRKTFDMPNYIRVKLMGAYKNRITDRYSDGPWRVIWDDDVNNWLAKHLSIHTGPQDTYNLNNAFVVRFDWAIQKYYLS